MTRRSYLPREQQVDLVQRRRSRSAVMYSEQPIPMDVLSLPGAGAGSIGGGPSIAANPSWLSNTISWTDPGMSWLT